MSGKKRKHQDHRMEQDEDELEWETFICPICHDLLKDPVAILCGHSYCMSCIKSYWDTNRFYSCPMCRETFKLRPKLMKNIMLADLVEELRKNRLQAAGAEDVACDVCTRRKLKALKSCLCCLASYCEKHLQPHFESLAFKKHKLVEPCQKLQENICSLHNVVMDMFCRTDQQCICYLCSVDEHKDHDTVTAAVERMHKQRELELSLEQVQQRLQDRKKDVKAVEQHRKDLNRSVDKAMEDNEKIFSEMIKLLKKGCAVVKQLISSRHEPEQGRIKDLEEKLQQEINELKKKDAELKQLSLTQDDNQFLLSYCSLSAAPGPSTHSSSINMAPVSLCEDVTAAVSQVRGQLEDILNETWTNMGLTLTRDGVLHIAAQYYLTESQS